MKLGLLLFLTVVGCTKSPTVQQIQGRTMGTYYSVKYLPTENPSSSESKKLTENIESILQSVNQQMSTYLADSEIDQLNKKYDGTPREISPWFGEVLKYSLELAESTGGSFDPTIGPLVNLWGFGPKGERKVPDDKLIQETKSYVGFQKVTLTHSQSKWLVRKSDPRVYIDLSATAKGFAVDQISEHLRKKGLINHLVDIGGEIKAMGQKKDSPWIVAVEAPSETESHVHLSFPLHDYGIATSGSYRNFFEQGGKKYSHTIESVTGRPIVHDLVSVSVLDSSCMKADGLATALNVMGPEKAWQYAVDHNLAAYFIQARPDETSPQKIKVIKKETPEFKRLRESHSASSDRRAS